MRTLNIIKVCPGRHRAWFATDSGFNVKKPCIPPEGCHKACFGVHVISKHRMQYAAPTFSNPSRTVPPLVRENPWYVRLWHWIKRLWK